MSFLRKLFGCKKPQPPKVQEKSVSEASDVWIVESLIQYTASKTWTGDIEEFIDKRCISFDDPEENRHEHYVLYKEFVALIEGKLETMLDSIGITPEQLLHALSSVQQLPRYKPFIEQMLNLEDYTLFRKMMYKRNKELEFESEKLIGGKPSLVEKDKAELDYAMDLSKKIHEKYVSELESEAEMLKRALKEAEESFKREMMALNLAIKDKYLKQAKKEEMGQNGKKEQEVTDENESLGQKDKATEIEAEAKAKELEFAQKKLVLENQRLEAEKQKQELEARMEKERADLNKRLLELDHLKKIQLDDDPFKEEMVKPNEGTEIKKLESLEQRRQRLEKQRDMFLKIRHEQKEKDSTEKASEVTYKIGQLGSLDPKELNDRKEIYGKIINSKTK